jgi:hypothetical protein
MQKIQTSDDDDKVEIVDDVRNVRKRGIGEGKKQQKKKSKKAEKPEKPELKQQKSPEAKNAKIPYYFGKKEITSHSSASLSGGSSASHAHIV